MAVPKRKTSKSKRDSRRSQKKNQGLNLTTCPQCGEAKLPHTACNSCGTYKGPRCSQPRRRLRPTDVLMPESIQKAVVVTGGSRGIGRAICEALAGPGTLVLFSYNQSADAAQKTATLVTEAGSEAVVLQMDVTDECQVKAFFDTVMDRAGRIDVLVNNVGVTRDGLIVRMKLDHWNTVLDTNLKGAFNCTKFVAKTMMKQRYGRIINIASVVGVAGNSGQANYVAAKAGLIGFTKAVARELAPRGITANAVAPGFVETDMTVDLPEKTKAAILAQIPLGRPARIAEVAAAVSFLASDQAAYITGQILHVNGGDVHVG